MRAFDYRYWLATRRRRHPPRAADFQDAADFSTSTGIAGFSLRLHRDQQGTISILSVFGLMILAMLLGMVINVSRQADNKIRMQNAADAGAYSGGLVLARGMNTLAFTNHLLCDVFALTAYMRESRDRMSESMVPDILKAWDKAGDLFSRAANLPKFQALGGAVKQKVPLEQELVTDFSNWASATSELVLPTLEMILEEEQIPNFQRALVMVTPELAQIATNDIAHQHGLGRMGMQQAAGGGAGASIASSGRGGASTPVRDYRGILWRTTVDPVGGQSEEERRTLPVVDPVMDEEPNQQEYIDRSRRQREVLSKRYLTDWNSETLQVFEDEAKMSQFRWLWEGFTCGQLEYLLDVEYPLNNLLFMIRTEVDDIENVNDHLERDFMFVGVVYCDRFTDILPGMFENPLQFHTQTHAQVMLFIPQPRLMKGWRQSDDTGNAAGESLGGVPGNILTIAPPQDGGGGGGGAGGGNGEWEPFVYRQNRSMAWNLLNQNWTVQLAPARASRLNEILSTTPRLPNVDASNLRLPDLRNVRPEDLDTVNSH